MSMAHIVAAILATLAFAVLCGSVVLWSWAIGKWSRGAELLPLAPRRPVPWGLFDLAIIFLLLLALMVGSQLTLMRLANLKPDVGMEQWKPEQLAYALLASSLATLLASALAVVVLIVRSGARMEDLGFSLRHLGRDIQLGAAGFVMLAPPMYGLQFLLTLIWKSEHPVQRLLLEKLDAGFVLIALFTAVLVAPVAEELLFRLMLQGWLENVSVLVRRLARGVSGIPDWSPSKLGDDFAAVVAGSTRTDVLREPLPLVEATIVATSDETLMATAALRQEATGRVESANPYAAPLTETTPPVRDALPEKPKPEPGPFVPAHWPMVVSAAIFALLHAGHGPDPIPLFFLAIGLGYFYQRTHRITPCIVVHLLVNSVSMLVLLVSLLFPEEFAKP
jgi:membrane protease YdiL (CAAX protease family)